MRAVNLIPSDTRRSGGSGGLGSLTPVHFVIGLLAVGLVFMTVYVLTNNTITARKAQVASLQSQAAQAQAEASQLQSYAQYQQMAQTRVQTVRQLAATRFDWQSALSDLSKVVPANASLQSLVATSAPGSGVAGASGAGSGGAATSSLRGAGSGPAFELKGCTATQDDVARLLSRLRLINGVTRVTLADSQKQDSNGATGPAVSGSTQGNNGAQGCGANAPSFDLVVFFQPIAGATAVAGASTSGQPVSTPAGAASTASGAASTASGAASTAPSTASGGASTASGAASTSAGGSK